MQKYETKLKPTVAIYTIIKELIGKKYPTNKNGVGYLIRQSSQKSFPFGNI